MSQLEDTLLFHIRAAGLPLPETQVRFAPPRRWRFDLCWVERRLAVEVDGGTWMARSRHTSGAGYEADCEKLNRAAILGYRVVRFTSTMITDGRALATLTQLLEEIHTDG